MPEKQSSVFTLKHFHKQLKIKVQKPCLGFNIDPPVRRLTKHI